MQEQWIIQAADIWIIKHDWIIKVTCIIPIFSSHMNDNYVHFIHTWVANSWSTSRIHPSWPRPQVRLSLLSTPFHIVSSLFVLALPSSLLFISTIHISHVHPPLTTRQLNTAIQVNNMGVLHLMYNGHIYTSHYYYYQTPSLHIFIRVGSIRQFKASSA